MGMTIDEAIKHAEEVAEANERLCETIHPSLQWSDYGKCAAEHRQLAEWLKELKQLREQTRWIPVSENLPKEGGDYLVTLCFDICGKETVREVMRNFFCTLSKKWLYEDEDVIAWQPLPKSYEAESEE